MATNHWNFYWCYKDRIVIVLLLKLVTTSNARNTAITETKTSTPSSTISTLVLQTTQVSRCHMTWCDRKSHGPLLWQCKRDYYISNKSSRYCTEQKREGKDSLVPAPLSPQDSLTPGTTITLTTITTTTMTMSKTNRSIKNTTTTILHGIRFSSSYFELYNKVL